MAGALGGEMSKSSLCISASILAIGCLLSGEAAAQGAKTGKDAPAEIEEVVVTARRIEENIQDVPVAVTAVSREKLDDLVINNIQDLNKLAPGLANGACSGTRNACAPVIRAQGTAFSTNRPSVVSYFAEVPNFEVSFYDLNNIQVVAGPQGTLFGETATGGVILYSPEKPKNEFGGYALVQGGNYRYKSFEGALNIPVIDDKLLVRGAVEYRKRRGYTTGIPSYRSGTVDLDNIDNLQWRLSVLWKPIERVENYFIYAGSRKGTNGTSAPLYYTDVRYMNPAVRNVIPANNPTSAAAFEYFTGFAPPAGKTWGQMIQDAQTRQLALGPRTEFYNYSLEQDLRFSGIINTTSWEISDNVTIRNMFGLNWAKARGPILQVDGVELPLVDSKAPLIPGSTRPTDGTYAYGGIGPYPTAQKGWPGRQWTDEIQIVGKLLDDRLHWQAGYYYRYAAQRDWGTPQGTIVVFGSAQGDPASAAFCASLGVSAPCSQITQSKDISYAGFAQATFAVTPNLNLTGGYRRTWDRRFVIAAAAPTQFVNFKGVNLPIAVDGRSPLPGSRTLLTLVPTSTADTYTLTADWRLNDSVLVYATRRTGYKGGGINSNATPGQPERTFGPEHLTDTEIGAKTNWRFGDITGRLNVAMYRDNYKDVQRSQILAGTATTITTNLANIKLKGVEIDGQINLTTWFRVYGNISHLDSKYTEFVETKPCSTQYWRPQCATLAPTSPVFIDHAKGIVTVGGQTINFEPDSVQDAPKWKWSLQPTVLLGDWTGEDISFGVNVQHLSSFAGNASNSNDIAGVPTDPQPTFLGPKSEPYFRDAYTVWDIRANWRHIKGGPISLAGSVTNVSNKLVHIGNAGSFTIGGTSAAIYLEPRMWYLEAKYEF